ncbi:MAG: tetratricopeptide repeat protein [Vampirovibrionales bacterium]|nr:tetratricopeptide repeat protein [Vampirovibrionales bacterium]
MPRPAINPVLTVALAVAWALMANGFVSAADRSDVSGPIAREAFQSPPERALSPAALVDSQTTPAKTLPLIIGRTVVTREWTRAERPASGASAQRRLSRPTSAAALMDPAAPPLPHYAGGAPPLTYTISGDPRVYTLASPTDEARVVDLKAFRATGAAPVEPMAMAAVVAPAAASNVQTPNAPSATAAGLMSQAVAAYQGGNVARALALIQQAAQQDPENPAIQAAQGEALIQTRNWPDALRAYERAMRLADIHAMRDRYLSRYAVALYLQGDRPQAIQRLASLLPAEPGARLGPAAYGAYLILGALQQQSGRPESAVAPLETATLLNPASAAAQYQLGLAYELTGRTAQALERYQRAKALNPESPEVTLALQRLQGAS